MEATFIKAGHYPSLPNELYHSDPAIGSSGIGEFLEVPRLYQYNYLEKKKVQTHQMKFGSGAHVYILEPESFHAEFSVAPDTIKDRKPKAWKTFVADCDEQGKQPMLHKEFVQLEEMRQELMRNRTARGILSSKCDIEHSYFAKDKETGLMLKSRPDILVDDIIIDYKTYGMGLGVSEYSRHAYGLKRHMQGYHHKSVVEMNGRPINKVWHLVQSTKAPYLVRIFEMTREWLDLGQEIVEYILPQMAGCKALNIYPDYSDTEISELILPGYAGMEIR